METDEDTENGRMPEGKAVGVGVKGIKWYESLLTK